MATQNICTKCNKKFTTSTQYKQHTKRKTPCIPKQPEKQTTEPIKIPEQQTTELIKLPEQEQINELSKTIKIDQNATIIGDNIIIYNDDCLLRMKTI